MTIEELDALYEAKEVAGREVADARAALRATGHDSPRLWHLHDKAEERHENAAEAFDVALSAAWPEVRERLRRAERLADAAISACECQGGLGDDAAMDDLRAALRDFDASAAFKAGDRVEVCGAGDFWQPAAVAQSGPRIIVHLDGERMPREVDAASVRRAALTSEPSR